MAQQKPKLETVVSSVKESRAVSPIIGIILMVAVTVALAAIVSTLMLGFSEGIGDMKPTADFVYTETDSGAVTVTHEGGSNFESGTVEVVYTNQTGSKVTAKWQGPIYASDSPQAGPFNVKTGTKIRVIWHAPDSGKSYTVSSSEVSK